MLGIRRYKEASIDLWQGDLTLFTCDVMVNAANGDLAGGGVNGAIHRIGGPSLKEETSQKHPDGCPTGEARRTGAGNLPARQVYHAVGPKWPQDGAAELLASVYQNCLMMAEEDEERHIAFPSISTGAYSYPIDAAAKVAMREIKSFLDQRTSKNVGRITMVLFSATDYRHYQKSLFETFPEEE